MLKMQDYFHSRIHGKIHEFCFKAPNDRNVTTFSGEETEETKAVAESELTVETKTFTETDAEVNGEVNVAEVKVVTKTVVVMDAETEDLTAISTKAGVVANMEAVTVATAIAEPEVEVVAETEELADGE